MKKLILIPALFLLILTGLVQPKSAHAQGTFGCTLVASAACVSDVYDENCDSGYKPDYNYCSQFQGTYEKGLQCDAAEGICVAKAGPTTEPDSGEGDSGAGDSGSADSSILTLCKGKTGINTAIGCIPISDPNTFIGFFLRWAIGIGGGIAFLLIVVAGFQIMTSSGNPEKLQAGKELMTSAIAGVIMLIFSVFILKVIGVDILGLGEFGLK